MPPIKSFFCWQGFDNGRRYLMISLSCYLVFLIFLPLLAKAPVLFVLLLLLTSPLLGLASMRRIHDAGFATPLAAVPLLVYWLCVSVISFSESGSSYTLLVLAFIATLATTTISNARKRQHQRGYVWGYSGPCLEEDDVNTSERRIYDRIEPTIAGKQSESIESEVTQAYIHDNLSPESATHSSSKSFNKTNEHPRQPSHQSSVFSQWSQIGWSWVEHNLRLAIALISLLVIIILLIVFWPTDGGDETKAIEPENNVVQLPAPERLHKLSMPDKFWLMLDKNEALTIAWQGDQIPDGEVWSALTGIGDKACISLDFGSRETFRSMRVTVKNSGDYYADFSPVDTQAIVKAVALKSRFGLCGFEFSLKGTQAILMTHKKYARYFDE